MPKEILPTITTTKPDYWREMINDVNKYDLKKIALFLTVTTPPLRQEIYQKLSEIKNLEIPFCHIRTDMANDELRLLKDHFGTQIFNIHPLKDYPLDHNLGEYKKDVLIENLYPMLPTVDELKQFGGICLDLSHLENTRLSMDSVYSEMVDLLDKFPIRANHISAVTKDLHFDETDHTYRYDRHFYDDLSQFDYLKNYPANYFSNYLAIEVANSIPEQLKAKAYIENLITDKLAQEIEKTSEKCYS